MCNRNVFTNIAPNHAGTMMGITNCAANIMSMLAPLVVGFVLDDAVSDPFCFQMSSFPLKHQSSINRKTPNNGKLCSSSQRPSTSLVTYNLLSLARLVSNGGMRQLKVRMWKNPRGDLVLPRLNTNKYLRISCTLVIV